MRPRRAELLVGAGGATLAAAPIAIAGHSPPAVALAAVLGGALGAARRQPVAALSVAVAALLVMAPLGALPSTAGFSGAFAVVAAHAFGAGRWVPRRLGVAGLCGLIAASELGVALAHSHAVPVVFIPLTAWAAGVALRERELVAARLAERARELDEERDAYAGLSVRYERARIASELHDIVAHALSVMVVQASAGQRLAATDAELTAETFDAIAGAARQAEQDMGRLVALLGDPEATGPAPDLALVQELIARAAGSGLNVSLRLEGDREGLPAPIAHAAYRVVQEGLTNALRYASGAAVRVLVRADAQTLTVEVANGPAAGHTALTGTGTGNGLRGLRERLSEQDATLDAGPTPDGGWLVTASLPRRVNATSLQP